MQACSMIFGNFCPLFGLALYAGFTALKSIPFLEIQAA
jgi:hypothetical protein